METHTEQDYLEKQSSEELKGMLWTITMKPQIVTAEAVVAIWELLRKRGDLDPNTIAMAGPIVKKAEKQVKWGRKWFGYNEYWYI